MQLSSFILQMVQVDALCVKHILGIEVIDQNFHGTYGCTRIPCTLMQGLRPLCLKVLGNSFKELVRSVKGTFKAKGSTCAVGHRR